MSAVITSARHDLDSGWETWIQTNLKRGCEVDGMVEEMVRKGFDPNAARQHVVRLQGPAVAGTRPVAVPGAYIHRESRIPKKSVIDIDGHRIQVMARWKRPTVVVMDNMLTPAECEEIMALSAPKLTRSSVTDPLSGGRQVIKDRTSDGAYFERGETELFKRIDRRIELLTSLPLEQGEKLQVMRYSIGGEYTPHFDYFPPHQKGSAIHTARGGQRIATMLMYLKPADEGGETEFPSVGLSIVPKQGSAVYFEYMDVDGRLDGQTLHAGLPVLAGEKWIATRWLRERAF